MDYSIRLNEWQLGVIMKALQTVAERGGRGSELANDVRGTIVTQQRGQDLIAKERERMKHQYHAN